jgi:peptidoglycan/xylan/chitin deacetylase (PgdA/CDA1 family)
VPNDLSIFTIDLEDWFHLNDSTWVGVEQWAALDSRVESTTFYLLGILEKSKIKATFFIMGWIAERYPELVKEIHLKGHEIGYHSYFHMRPFRQNPTEFEDDLSKGLKTIENIIGQKVIMYRAPNFSLIEQSLFIIEILIKYGIKVSSSIKGYRRIGSLQIPNTPFIWETKSGE